MATDEEACSSPFPDDGMATICDRNFQGAIETLSEREKEIAKLHGQIQEILRINHYWEEEYSELKKSYDLLHEDFKKLQQESHTATIRYKKEKASLKEQLETVKVDKDKTHKKLNELRAKYDNQKKLYNEVVTQLKSVTSSDNKTPPTTPVPDTMIELREKMSLLTSQLQAYKEDFEAEKRDKERHCSERETDKLRYEAEIASLKIQLDRFSRDLNYYKNESIRLSQQLRLKQQREDDEYRKHLEKQGYSPTKPLPPLDPYVEKDLYHSNNHSPPVSPTLTTPTSCYQTYMSETRPPNYHPRVQRRISMPARSKPSDHYHSNEYHHGNQHHHGDEVSRSVSPQIYRFGNLRLYSRQSNPDLTSNIVQPNNID